MDKREFFYMDSVTGGYGKKEVLHDVSFYMKPHTLTCLVGKNGCGKTTLLKCIINQLSHEGSSYLKGAELEKQSLKNLSRMISYIPQKNGVTISLQVLDVVLMGYNPVLKLLENPSKKQKEQAKEALRIVGMEEYIFVDYLTLSEGQKQLVVLARMIIEDTSLLILDEPDSALDFTNRYRIMSHITDIISKSEKAGILCLHDPMLALEFCHQLLLLKDGKCVAAIYPKTDSVEKIEEAFQSVYENVTLIECFDKKGRRHLNLVWDGEV